MTKQNAELNYFEGETEREGKLTSIIKLANEGNVEALETLLSIHNHLNEFQM